MKFLDITSPQALIFTHKKNGQLDYTTQAKASAGKA
jgi:hypothetical protein